MWFVVCYMFVTCVSILFMVCSLLFVVYSCSQCGVCRLVFVARCSWFVVRCLMLSLLVVGCVLFVCWLLLFVVVCGVVRLFSLFFVRCWLLVV